MSEGDYFTPGKLYKLVPDFEFAFNEELCELKLTPEKVVRDVKVILHATQTPMMFLGETVVHYPSNTYLKDPNVTSAVAKLLFGDRVVYLAIRTERENSVSYSFPVFQEWDMKEDEE
jgi:hypothetical protein